MPIDNVAVSSLTRTMHVLGEKLKDDPAKIRKSATDFEAMLLKQLIGAAHVDAGEDDQANSSLVELGQQQFAQALASSGGLGIAKMVVAGLTKHADR
jgi:Rod binding domain-containing protein